MRIYLVIIILVTIFFDSFSLNISDSLPIISLSGKNGGLISGESWQSNSLVDKVSVVFYASPDMGDVNKYFYEALIRENFSLQKARAVAIINVAAVWYPKIFVHQFIKYYQNKYPNTTYVIDNNKIICNLWNVDDHSNDVLIFNRNGKLIYYHNGQLNDIEIADAIKLIRDSIYNSF